MVDTWFNKNQSVLQQLPDKMNMVRHDNEPVNFDALLPVQIAQGLHNDRLQTELFYQRLPLVNGSRVKI